MKRFLISMLTAGLLAGCDLNFGEDYTLNASTFTDEHIKTIERVSRLTLPEGTRGLNMFYQGSGIDDALLAKLEIPDGKVPELRNRISAVIGTEGSASGALADGHAWWNESRMEVDLHRSLNVESDYLELILGQADGKWILLVQWFST